VLQAFDTASQQAIEPLVLSDQLLDASDLSVTVAKLRLRAGLGSVLKHLGVDVERSLPKLVLRDADGVTARARARPPPGPGYAKLTHHRELVEFAALQVR